MPKILDISLPLDESLVTYPGDPRFAVDRVAEVDPSDPGSYNISLFHVPSHAGTHIDPPRHFVKDGQPVDFIDPGVLIGPARVVEFGDDVKTIGEAHLREKRLEGVERLILKTSNSKLPSGRFVPDFAHLGADGARHIREHTKIRLVGIDFISIETGDPPGFPVHHELLAKDPAIYILEGLRLAGVAEGDYTLVCLPLRIAGADGGPARAILMVDR